MILLIDNYDSFTWNLAHLIGGLGRRVDVVRNDALTAEEALGRGANAIVLSPGPCTPNEAGICLDLVSGAVKKNVPVFGVCLGLQSIIQALGGRVIRAARPMHGKVSAVTHKGGALFEGVPQGFSAARYHSLIGDAATLPSVLRATAHADGEIMAAEHASAPIAGVQFHPESIATEHGARLIENFLVWARR
jgi:anthranilate synthase component 2